MRNYVLIVLLILTVPAAIVAAGTFRVQFMRLDVSQHLREQMLLTEEKRLQVEQTRLELEKARLEAQMKFIMPKQALSMLLWLAAVVGVGYALVTVRHYLQAKLHVELATNLNQCSDKAFDMFLHLQEANVHTLRALKPQVRSSALPEQHTLPEQQALPAASIPAFREILEALEPGDEMVLGFDAETNEPVTGKLESVHSAGVFGVSGSGKTSLLYAFISQTLLLFPGVRFAVLDLHCHHPQGLVAGLPKTRHFTILDPDDFRQGLLAFIREMDERLESGKDYRHAPRFLIVDELPELVRKPQGGSLQAALGRILKEGRKVFVYAVISGQDTRLKGSIDDRSLLTSLMVFNADKDQARYALKDSEFYDTLHGKIRKNPKPGLCVFKPTNAAPLLMQCPYCRPDDVQYVTAMVGDGMTVDVPIETVTPVETGGTPVQEMGKAYLSETGLSQNGLADQLGITRKDMSLFMNDKPMSAEKRMDIETRIRSLFRDEMESVETA